VLPVLVSPGQQLTADGTGRGYRLIQAPEQFPGPVKQRLAGQRELYPVGRAAQQLAADQPFEAADLSAQRGLGQVEAGCGAAEVELVGHGDERAQLLQFDRVRRLWQRDDLCVHSFDYDSAAESAVMPSVHDCHA